MDVLARTDFFNRRFNEIKDYLRNICFKTNFQNSGKINGTTLRKYDVTVVQLFDVQNTHLDMVSCRHLRHNLRVHRNFYRLQKYAAGTSIVSKMLLLINNGKSVNLRGKI